MSQILIYNEPNSLILKNITILYKNNINAFTLLDLFVSTPHKRKLPTPIKMQVPITTYLRIKPSINTHTSYTNTTLTHTKASNLTYHYTVNHIFPPTTNNTTIKEHIKILHHIVKGHNTTILCYGNTGAGKTHTMFGTATDAGLVYTLGMDILTYIGSLKKLMPCSIKIACFEIYNEKIIQQGRLCKMQGNLIDLNSSVVESIEDYKEILENVQKERKTAFTVCNEKSSRSHTVIRLFFEVDNVCSYLHLVDLAGSEDNRITMNTGLNLKESSCINKSLFVLNSCVRAVLNKALSVPYRDSMLTKVLKDSIGGSSVCFIIGCVDLDRECEMVRTCEFVSKSRKVMSAVGKYTVPEVNKTMNRFDRLSTRKVNNNKDDCKLKKITSVENKSNEILTKNEVNIFGNRNIVGLNSKEIEISKAELGNKDCKVKRKVEIQDLKNNTICECNDCKSTKTKLNIYSESVSNKENIKTNNPDQNINKNRKIINESNTNSSNTLNFSNNYTFTSNTVILSSIAEKKEPNKIKAKRLPLSDKTNILSPNTLSKSYKAFHSRAIEAELAGNKKSAIADYRTLQKLKHCPFIETKIKNLITKNNKKNIPREEIVNVINSADFFRIKEIKGVGNKRAELIVKYINEYGGIEYVDDLVKMLGEKVVKNMMST